MQSKPYKTDLRLDGKVALVTGAASGIGLAVAQVFGSYGATVCLCDLEAQKAGQLAAKLPGAKGYGVNVADEAAVDALVKAVVADFGRIDIVVNSAGVGDIEWAKDMPAATWRKVLDINLTGSFLVAQRAGRQMIKQGEGGKIISLASQAGLVAIDKHAAYSASKAGIISLTKSLAYEWGQYGIQVNAISPTATETPIIAGYWDEPERYKKTMENTPAGRYCKPEEIAMAALFLASDAANMITGENLVVDGGYTIH